MKTSSMPAGYTSLQKINTGFHQMHIIFPFRPSMWEKGKTEKVYGGILRKADKELIKSGIALNEKIRIMGALLKLLKSLNLASHRKAVLISIYPGKAEMLYLNDHINKKIIINKPLSLRNMASDVFASPAFFLLQAGKQRTVLYEYHKHILNTIANLKNTPGNSQFSQIDGFLKLLQTGRQQPVFVCGNTEMIANFRNQSSMPDILFTVQHSENTLGNIQVSGIAESVSKDWLKWKQLFNNGLLLHAMNSGTLICGKKCVESRMNSFSNGILFIEKSLSEEDIFSNEKEKNIFYKKVHKFLAEGNSIIELKSDDLKAYGGLAIYNYSDKPYTINYPVKEELLLL